MRPPYAQAVRRKVPSLPPVDVLVAEVLGFLGDDPDRFARFLSASGLATGDLRAVAATPGFAESLLAHLCADERLLVTFAASKGYDPASIERVRQSLTPVPED